MIEKKLSSDSESLNETFPADDENHLHEDDQHEETLYPGYSEQDEDDLLDESGDPEAEAAKRKRKGNLIFYGGIAALFAVVAVLGYPQIKRTFFKEQPKQVATAGVPVPLKARESKFTLAGTEDSSVPPASPVAPSGAVTSETVAQPSTQPVSGAGGQMAQTGDDTPVAVAPPPSLPVAPASSIPLVSSGTQAAGTASTTSTTTTTSPPSPVMKTTDVSGGQMQAHIADLDGKVSALQANIATLMAQKDANAASFQQLQATLNSLQTQISAIGSAKPQPAAAMGTEAAPAIHKSTAHKPHSVASSSDWTLRSAVTGMALLGQPGNNELKRVSVGDTVSGLGKILSISEQNGNWVVKGTSGSVVQ